MKRMGLLFLIYLCLLIIVACNQKNNDDVVAEIEYHKEGNVIKITQRDTVNQILNILESAQKNKKVIDVGKTDEKIVVNYSSNVIKIFDLYIDFDKSVGMVVMESDSNYACELSSQSIKDLKIILKGT
ncbi:hypothetical protein [Paenibacillus xylanexedens]|uniref:hypothetical protein n=1 Tax=Paenibacillus xylanexedens TaxID=528191 RepID=UPI003D01E730